MGRDLFVGKNKRQFFIPEGFAHGYCVLSERAHVVYKCSDYYHPEDESGILWSDPTIGIDWPTTDPTLSPKDANLSCLPDLPPEKRFNPAKKAHENSVSKPLELKYSLTS